MVHCCGCMLARAPAAAMWPINAGERGGAPAGTMVAAHQAGTPFECPACAQAVAGLQTIRQRVDDGACLVFRHLPLVESHPHALPCDASFGLDPTGDKRGCAHAPGQSGLRPGPCTHWLTFAFTIARSGAAPHGVRHNHNTTSGSGGRAVSRPRWRKKVNRPLITGRLALPAGRPVLRKAFRQARSRARPALGLPDLSRSLA